jgi:uncharacterized peroxidase-related enzyme
LESDNRLVTFIETIPEAEASPALAALYEADREMLGEVGNFTRAFSLRPEVNAAWRALSNAIKSNMDVRRYELATLAAARRLKSTYCALAHGSVLASQFMEPAEVAAIMRDHHAAGLDELDVAVMDLADKVVADATSVTEADVERLRTLGLTDAEILDVVLAAAVRCFFSKTLDAVAAEPDAKYAALDPELLDALTVGRPLQPGEGR